MEATVNNAAQAAPVSTPSSLTQSVSKFFGAFTNGFARGTSTSLKVVTLLVEATESTVILGVAKASQATKLDKTTFGTSFTEGFQEGQLMLDTLEQLGTELGKLDASSFAKKTA